MITLVVLDTRSMGEFLVNSVLEEEGEDVDGLFGDVTKVMEYGVRDVR